MNERQPTNDGRPQMSTYEVKYGEAIWDVAEKMIAQAKEQDEDVTATFNGIEITATKNSERVDIVAAFQQKMEAKGGGPLGGKR